MTADGLTIQPGITVPANALSVTVNASGEVLVEIAGQVAAQNVGQLQLASFLNPAGLQALGDNLFRETTASGTATLGVPGAAGFGEILQGFLEASNVNTVSEITNLIAAQRAYEMNSRVISTADEMMNTINQVT